MALGLNRRRSSRHAEPALDDYPEETTIRSSGRGAAAINAETSAALVERFRRDRTNVRPYVRTSTQKLKWTHELHQCFMRAVDKLGGQDKATPKKILHLMNREGITIAHIKSHLQMFRSGKINAEGLSKSEYKTWRGGEWHHESSSNAGASEDFNSALALIQLREDSGRSNSDSAGAASPDSNFSSYVHKKSRAIQQLHQADADMARGRFVMELNEQQQADGAAPSSSSYNQPHSWTPSDPFLNSHPVDVTEALSGSKRKAEEVNIELTMATRAPSPPRPSFEFPPPPGSNLRLTLS